jgi:hypothetical protein
MGPRNKDFLPAVAISHIPIFASIQSCSLAADFGPKITFPTLIKVFGQQRNSSHMLLIGLLEHKTYRAAAGKLV